MALKVIPYIIRPYLAIFKGAIKTLFSANLQASILPGFADPNTVTTYARNSTGTFVDFEGIVRTAKLGEPRFAGARRVANFATNSDDFTGSFVTLNSTAIDGNTFTFDNPFLSLFYLTGFDFTASAGRQIVASAYVTAQTDIDMNVSIFEKDGTQGEVFNYSLSAGVTQRVFASATLVGDGTGAIEFALGASAVGTITANDWQLEDVTGQADQNASEYVSRGVLTAPFHGAGVDGVKYFTTKRDGSKIGAADSYADASGPHGYLSETEFTNNIIYSEALDLVSTTVNSAFQATPHLTWSGDISSTVELRDDSSGGLGFVRISTVSPQLTFNLGVNTVSVFVKAGSHDYYKIVCSQFAGVGSGGGAQTKCNATFKLIDEGGVTANTDPATSLFIAAGTDMLANGWVRCWVTFDASTDAEGYFQSFIAINAAGTVPSTPIDGTSYMLIGGMQVDSQPFPTSYTKTDGIAYTRIRDSLTYSEAGNIDNAEGSLTVEGRSNLIDQSVPVGDNKAILCRGNAVQTYIQGERDAASVLYRTADGINVKYLLLQNSPEPMYPDPSKVAMKWSVTDDEFSIALGSKTNAWTPFQGNLTGDLAVGGFTTGSQNFDGTLRNIRINE